MMADRVMRGRSAWRRVVAGVTLREGPVCRLPGAVGRPRALLLVGVMAANMGVSAGALAADAAMVHPRRTAGVVMVVGGMSGGDDMDRGAAALPVAAPAATIAAPDDTARRSVVLQPGDALLSVTDAIRQTSAAVAARVMAFSPIIDEAAHVAQVDSALLMAVIDVESGGNPQAVSPKGATGLMQLMPGTGERHGASNLFDPRQNIAAGARYLGELKRQFGELPLALAAYNAGEGAVQKYGGQIPPYAETMNYVPKVIARYRWYRAVMSSTGGASVQEVAANARGRFMVVRPDLGN